MCTCFDWSSVKSKLSEPLFNCNCLDVTKIQWVLINTKIRSNCLHGNIKWSDKAPLLFPSRLYTDSLLSYFFFTFIPAHDEHNHMLDSSLDYSVLVFPATISPCELMDGRLRSVHIKSHHRCRISAGLIWFWECCSSGLISVRSPVCCPWRGRLSQYTSDQTGTSLKRSSRQKKMQHVTSNQENYTPIFSS